MTSPNHLDTPMPLRVQRAWDAADGMRSYELVQADGTLLPPFTPGAHIKVQVPSGQVRKYSLCNAPDERRHYLITVKREASGQGGSASLVNDAHEGDTLYCSVPDNAFPLVAEAPAYLFIAGGIGITPIMAMIRSFGELAPVPWKLVYLTRSPESTAFLDELSAPQWAGRVHIHHDHGDAAQAFDLWPVLQKPNSAHLYCCGPRPLMDAVRDMSGHWSPANVHFESFTEGGEVVQGDQAFTVQVASSGQRYQVPVGKTILAVLREHGVDLPSSCESGTCGTCRTGLISGEGDHRDFCLMPDEFASAIMVCVSRAKSAELVLDL